MSTLRGADLPRVVAGVVRQGRQEAKGVATASSSSTSPKPAYARGRSS
ncbi:hypothetical protein ON003_07995 [Janibacter hoylei]|nr:hypothetical protein [Janibacter hoylei]MCW4601535.1 hypothetical protein [Janibacter hoylei]